MVGHRKSAHSSKRMRASLGSIQAPRRRSLADVVEATSALPPLRIERLRARAPRELVSVASTPMAIRLLGGSSHIGASSRPRRHSREVAAAPPSAVWPLNNPLAYSERVCTTRTPLPSSPPARCRCWLAAKRDLALVGPARAGRHANGPCRNALPGHRPRRTGRASRHWTRASRRAPNVVE